MPANKQTREIFLYTFLEELKKANDTEYFT